jgi:hypothetical protein
MLYIGASKKLGILKNYLLEKVEELLGLFFEFFPFSILT